MRSAWRRSVILNNGFSSLGICGAKLENRMESIWHPVCRIRLRLERSMKDLYACPWGLSGRRRRLTRMGQSRGSWSSKGLLPLCRSLYCRFPSPQVTRLNRVPSSLPKSAMKCDYFFTWHRRCGLESGQGFSQFIKSQKLSIPLLKFCLTRKFHEVLTIKTRK